MKLTFYTTSPDEIDIRPAGIKRDWMDKTTQSFAYRCLPLNVSNAHGWCFHSLHDFTAVWNGRPTIDGITLQSPQEDLPRSVVSVFGHGVLTFHMHGVFRTEPNWDIIATGPLNSPKHGISPLTGVIETDWSPYSFTMNWKFTRPNVPIRFKIGEPFCMVYPVQRGILETVEPEIRHMKEDRQLFKDHTEWSRARSQFIKDLKDPESMARQEKWQKAYYLGKQPDQSQGCPNHKIKLRLKEFELKSDK